MVLYSQLPGRRVRQILGDLLLAVWIVVWVRVALGVREATLALADPGRQIDQSASGLARWLRDAGSKVGEIPLVGDGVSAPFEGAGDAAAQLAAAGQAQVEAVQSLALWLGIAVAVIPVLCVAAFYVPLRWRFVRRATAGRRFVDSAADLDLFALRALSHQPLHVLAKISDDPAGAWREGDRSVIARLADLELRDCGLAAPPAR